MINKFLHLLIFVVFLTTSLYSQKLNSFKKNKTIVLNSSPKYKENGIGGRAIFYLCSYCTSKFLDYVCYRAHLRYCSKKQK